MIDKDDLAVMDPEGVVDSSDELHMTTQGRMLAKFMAATLMKHYPGWRWGITVNERGGVVHVFALELSGELGYTLRLDDLWNGGNFDWKLILVAGGEILERYGLPRRGKQADWQGHVTWSQGLAVPDVTDKKKGLLRHFSDKIMAGNGTVAGPSQ